MLKRTVETASGMAISHEIASRSAQRTPSDEDYLVFRQLRGITSCRSRGGCRQKSY
jgi:hypothetical protein